MNDISVEYGTTSDGLMAARVDGLHALGHVSIGDYLR